MKKYTFYICLFIVVLSACREETQVNKIGGVLFQDCQNRLANAEVALKANIGLDFGDPLILGTGISNSQGEFYFNYELEEEDEGTADLLLIKNNGFDVLIEDIELNVDQSLVLYRYNLASLLVNLAGSRVYSGSDTLFYGLTVANQESYKVQPINGIIDTFNMEVPNLISGATTAVFYYGLGSVEYGLAFEALSIPDSSFQNIPVTLLGCNVADTAKMIIN